MSENGPPDPVAALGLVDETESLHFLNTCLCDAQQVHLLVLGSMTSDVDGTAASILLEESVQSYLGELLQKYASSVALRKKLVSGECLHFLDCLTRSDCREEFIAAAASPEFVRAVL
ncbi:hypothetical protein STCU_00692 [Strigomonas culicis]|uniref:Uncharacterized protein n=1 Tax=Strigomonas culicis TaxID=28005 RepID=S9WAU1_9TRYP|nr:hypothetical protein STCU_00692 [Strigomonas culicis]|eukprot:EPY36226.1 hypothetical protein STCU_00692 [Strigomonas culicis]